MTDPPRRNTIRSRCVSFDLSRTRPRWIPDEPAASHSINVLHMLMPAGEQWFVKVFREALPRITDPRLRSEVEWVIGQESNHGIQHSHVLDRLTAQGFDTTSYTRHVDRLFNVLLGERPPAGLPIPERQWLRFRVSVAAAAEQFGAALGDWVLNANRLDLADADPVMLNLLRWHGAEEIEHRSVVFDLYEHIGGRPLIRYFRRVESMLLTAPVLLWLWMYGAAHLMRQDPELRGHQRYSLREHNKAVRKGLLPTWRELVMVVPRFFRRSYHPSQEGSLYTAVHYLTRSPAVRAADEPADRAAAS